MESNNLIFKLKIPKNSTSTSPVFLVDFSNGRLNLNDSKHLEFTSYRHVQDENDSNARRMLVANNGRLNYKGTSFENNHNPLMSSPRYCIGVRNKTTGRMKIYTCVLFHLKPIMNSAVTANLPSEDKNYREKMDLLTMNFGSKGKKRVVNARLKYSVESVPSADALEDIKLNESSLMNKTSSPSTPTSTIEYIPPQNREAQTPSEVYNIHDIISPVEEEHLFYLAESLLQEYPNRITEWKQNGTYCKYVLSHLEKTRDIEKVKCLVYYNYLVMFSKLTYKDIKKVDPIPEIEEPFKSKLLECFTISSYTETGKRNRNLPLKMKDKLASYLVVLALIIDDYCVDIALVTSDLKFGLTAISNIAQALGCHIATRKVRDAALKFAELKLPLVVYRKPFRK